MNKILLRRHLCEILAVTAFGFYAFVLLIVASNYYYWLTFEDVKPDDQIKLMTVGSSKENEHGHEHKADAAETLKKVGEVYWIFFQNHIDAWRVFAIVGMGYGFVNILLTAAILLILITNISHLDPELKRLKRARKLKKMQIETAQTPDEIQIDLQQMNSNSNSSSNSKSKSTDEMEIEKEIDKGLKEAATRNFLCARILFLSFVILTIIFSMVCFLVLLLSKAVADQKIVKPSTRWARAYFGIVAVPGLAIFIAIIISIILVAVAGFSCAWKNPFNGTPTIPGINGKSPSAPANKSDTDLDPEAKNTDKGQDNDQFSQSDEE